VFTELLSCMQNALIDREPSARDTTKGVIQ
jgi:hypothetical protein